MADEKLVRLACQNCGKAVGVRPDQFGRRLRCPACRTTFRIEPPPAAVAKSSPPLDRSPPPPPPPEPEYDVDILADEAGELVSAGPARRVAATARFHQPPAVVFEATAFAVRRAGGEVLALDRANLHVRFTAGAGEHTAYVFPGPTGGSELDIRSAGLGGRADEILYGQIAAELAAYLAAHHAHALATAAPAPLSFPPAPPPPPPPRRRRSREGRGGDGFGVGSLVVAVVAMALFCIPIAAIPLGSVAVVLGMIGLLQGRGGRGLAVAGLAVGLVAVVVSGLFFLVLFADSDRERRRGRSGAVGEQPPAQVAQRPNQALQQTAGA